MEKSFMNFGDYWDLTFRSFLVFIFFGLVWLKFLDPYISCSIGFPVPLLIAVLYWFWGRNRARKKWLKEQEEELELETY